MMNDELWVYNDDTGTLWKTTHIETEVQELAEIWKEKIFFFRPVTS